MTLKKARGKFGAALRVNATSGIVQSRHRILHGLMGGRVEMNDDIIASLFAQSPQHLDVRRLVQGFD